LVDKFYLSPLAFNEALGEWEHQREDFHWPEASHPVFWDLYRAGQQDFAQEGWQGLVAAIDGSVNRTREAMGAGVVVGKGRVPDFNMSFPVGGPLATLRSEAAALEALMAWAADDVPLLVFVDCLALLAILARWGQEDFWPDNTEIKHFDIIESCLHRLRSRRAATLLVKVKSHSGILMNERADALADLGCSSEDEPRWPAHWKLDPLRLSPRDSIRTAYAPFPDRRVCDKQLVRRASEGVEKATALARGTIFAKEMLQDPANCAPILAAIPSQPDSTVRLWIQVVCGLYPTMARLHRVFPAKFHSANCQWCGANVPETLCHFVSVCSKFHHARTAAHNRAWQTIVKDLKRSVLPGWQFFIETTIQDTGLLGNHLPSARRLDGRPTIREVERYRNLRPDAVVVNPSLKKVAIMDLTRPFDGQDRDDDQPRLPTQPRAETLNCERPEPPHGVDDAASRTGSSEGLQGTSHTASTSTHGRSRITAAVLRKLSAYGGLAEAVRQLKGGDEWQVEVLPWLRYRSFSSYIIS